MKIWLPDNTGTPVETVFIKHVSGDHHNGTGIINNTPVFSNLDFGDLVEYSDEGGLMTPIFTKLIKKASNEGDN